jgi:hypothetical protein
MPSKGVKGAGFSQIAACCRSWPGRPAVVHVWPHTTYPIPLQPLGSVYRAMMRRKLGLLRLDEGSADDALVESLLTVMAETGADWTNTFRRLATFPMPLPQDAKPDTGAAGVGIGSIPAGGGSGSEAAAAAEDAPAGASGSGRGGAEGEAAGAPPALAYPDGGFLAAQLAELASAEEMARASTPRIPEANLQVPGLGQRVFRSPPATHSRRLATHKWRACNYPPSLPFQATHLRAQVPLSQLSCGQATPPIPPFPQMLQFLAARDPAMLHSLGITAEFIKVEAARAAAAAKWRATSPEAKAQRDTAAWTSWLGRYGARLAREAAAGGGAAERLAAMNAANPRVVLRNWGAVPGGRGPRGAD